MIKSNFSFNPDLLHELNARYLHNMNNNLYSKDSSSNKILKSSKWCTAHVKVSWMIYYQQQSLKEKLSYINSNPSIAGLTSLFSSNRKSDIPLSSFHRINQSFSSSIRHENQNYSSFGKSSPLSPCPTIDPLVVSIIEQQRLSSAYASLVTSTFPGKNFDPRRFHLNNNVLVGLIRHEQLRNSLRPSEQKYHRGNSTEMNRILKTKFEESSPIHHQETKRFKRDNTLSPIWNSLTPSCIDLTIKNPRLAMTT